MQGIYINGRRPTSKKQVKEAFASCPESVRLEATSAFGNEYDGIVAGRDGEDLVVYAPQGEHYFVGPDPYNKRNFYGTIVVKGGRVTVK